MYLNPGLVMKHSNQKLHTGSKAKARQDIIIPRPTEVQSPSFKSKETMTKLFSLANGLIEKRFSELDVSIIPPV